MLLRRCFVAVPQGLDLIVIAPGAFVLTANDLLDFRGEIFFKRLAIAIDRDVFTALAFVQHRLIVIQRNGTAYSKPPSMNRAGRTAAGVSFATKPRHEGL